MSCSLRLHLLSCLILFASSANGIMVKYGTNGGPIVPPTPEPELPVPQPYRAPAPVWEERSNDSPDPNAQWRPQFSKPQPRYTQLVFNQPPAPPPSNAQKFVKAYVCTNPKCIQVEVPKKYFIPAQFLSSQSLPGVGLRYFVPEYINNAQGRVLGRQEDAKYNAIHTNDIDEHRREGDSDLQWKFEKDSTRRLIRDTQEGAAGVPEYIWPAYIPPSHQ